MPRSFGLDLKGNFLLCSETHYEGNQLGPIHLSYAQLPESALLENGALDWAIVQDVVTGHLGAVLGEDSLSIVLEDPGVVTRTSILPANLPIPPEEFLQKEVLEFKVFENKDPVLDFVLTGVVAKEGEESQAVLELVVDRDLIGPWQDIFIAQQPKDAFAESAMLAQLRTYFWLVPPTSSSQILVVCEDSQSHVVNLQGGAVRFLRTFEIGSQALLSAGENRPLGSTELMDAEDDFLDELIRTVRYIMDTYKDQVFEECLHLIARSFAPGLLSEHIQQRLGAPVYGIDPFQTLPIQNWGELSETGMDGLLFVQAIGASLRPVSPKLVPLSVFPKEHFEQREIKKSAIALLAPVAAGLLLPLMISGCLSKGVKSAHLAKIEQETRLASLKATVARKGELSQTLTYLKTKNKGTSGDSSGTNDWPAFIFELTNLVPNGMWLKGVTYEATGKVTFEGVALDPKAMLIYEQYLKQSPYLTDVIRGSSSQAKLDDEAQTAITNFTMTASLKVREG